MSLKTDIEMVKEELSSEEKFFEKAVVTEKFVKKYKNALIGSVVIVVLLVAGNIAYTISEQNRVAEANTILLELQNSGSNKAKQAMLHSLSPALHDVWMYSKAVADNDANSLKSLKSSKNPLIQDLASYELALDSNSVASFESYANGSDAIYADLAKVESAVLLMNEKKIDEAHIKLSQISVTSPLAQVAKTLMHYGVK